MSNAGIIGGQIGGELARRYTPFIFSRLNLPRLTEEEVKRINSQRYPKFYESFLIVYIFGFITSAIVWMFLCIDLFGKLQKELFASQALYFGPDFGAFLFGFINFFTGLLIFGVLMSYIFYFLGSSRFKDWLNYQSLKGGVNVQYLPAMNQFLKLALVIYIFTLPITLLSLKDFKAIYFDKVVDNDFFSLTQTIRPLSDIKEATIVAKQGSSDGKIYYSRVGLLTFHDQTTQEFNSDIPKFKSAVKTLNIPLTIIPPPSQAVQLIQQSCVDNQQEFYELFELSIQPIKNGSSNFWGICIVN